MPTINGVKHKPVVATEAQKALILKFKENKDKAKKIHEENDLILQTLSGEILDKAICYDTGLEKRTIMVSKPTGKFIHYSQLDFVHDAKTTKEDSSVFDEGPVIA